MTKLLPLTLPGRPLYEGLSPEDTHFEKTGERPLDQVLVYNDYLQRRTWLAQHPEFRFPWEE